MISFSSFAGGKRTGCVRRRVSEANRCEAAALGLEMNLRFPGLSLSFVLSPQAKERRRAASLAAGK